MTEGTDRSSPLDGHLVIFLRFVEDLNDGYRPLAHAGPVAERGGWHPAFSTALYDSAKSRRLIEPYQPRRNVTRWRVSRLGKAWLDDRTRRTGGASDPRRDG